MRTDPFENEYKKCNSGTNAEKMADIPRFPDIVDIELTNKCNLRCPMCPTGRKELKRKRGFMDEVIFMSILYECEQHKTPIRLVRWGEPMLHPDFWELIEYANICGIKIHLNTNGYFLTEMKAPIDSIKISIHESSDKQREALNNLSQMDCFRAFSVTDEEDFVNFASLSPCGIREDAKGRIDRITKYRTYRKGMDAPRLPNCPEVFNKLSVNWDGTVSACCNDYDNLMLVGDIRQERLIDIWRGKKMHDYRKLIVEDKHWNLPLCSECYDLGAY